MLAKITRKLFNNFSSVKIPAADSHAFSSSTPINHTNFKYSTSLHETLADLPVSESKAEKSFKAIEK
jgi:hypothetical protein